MLKHTQTLALLCAATLLAGCGTSVPQPSGGGSTPPPVSQSASNSASSVPAADPAPALLPEDDTIYTIYLDTNQTLKFDSKGNLLSSTSSAQLEQDQDQLVPINDVLTGEPAYQKHTLVEPLGEPDEYGNVQLRRSTALYDLSGKLLVDYGAYDYGDALGELLVRKDHRGMWVSVDDVPMDYFSELWHPKTGQTVQRNVHELQPLDEGKARLLATDVFGGALGFVDAQGQTLVDMDETVSYYNLTSWNGMFIGRDQHPLNWEGQPKSWLLTPELTPIASYEWLQGNTTPDGTPYLEYRDEAGNTGLLDADQKLLFTPPGPEGRLDMFDGELVMCNALAQPADGNYSRVRQLMRLDGTPVGKPYEQLEIMNGSLWNLTQKPQQFVGRQGELVEIFDRQGQVLASSTIPKLESLQIVNEKLLAYGVPAGEYAYAWGLLDTTLQTKLEAGKYTSIYSMGGDKDATTFICGRYDVRSDLSRLDVFDQELRPIATALTQIGTTGKDRFAAVRGFQAGVMDLQGNWIGSVSIFQNTGDETLSEEDYF